MLEDLDTIDWAAVSHAYGPATTMPDLLRALTSSDAEVYEQAIGELFNSICHQGTVYEATATAVPFLIRLAAAAEIRPRADILGLLGAAADGSGYLEAHGQMDFYRRMRQTPEFEQMLDNERRVARAAFDAVTQGAGVYLRLLNDPDPQIRMSAADLLPLCASISDEIEATLRFAITQEADALVKASLVRALVKTWAAPGFRPETPRPLSEEQAGYLAQLFGATDENVAVRVSAAAGLLADHRLAMWDEVRQVCGEALNAYGSADTGMPMPYGLDTLHLISTALRDEPRLFFDWLIELLGSPDEKTIDAVSFHLGNLINAWRWASEAAAPHLIRLAESDNPKLVSTAVYRLAHVGKSAAAGYAQLRYLAEHAEQKSTQRWAEEACQHLDMVGQENTAEDVMRGIYTSKDELASLLQQLKEHIEKDADFGRELWAVIRGLEARGAEAREAAPWLEKALDHRDSWVRAYAARALWAINGPDSVAIILPALLADLNPWPYAALVIDCLKRMGHLAREAAPELTEIASSERRFADDPWLDEALQAQAIDALAAIGGE